ncbi:MAG: AtzE family amidohydrolase [Pseudomonadota bacterium]|nr:AtzE family amidohydrolase [Pseudomonadota bacterium]
MADLSAGEIAAGVCSRDLSARDVIDAALRRIDAGNPRLNCFSATFRARALGRADALDARIAREPGACLPLAGVPFGAKNLFDVEGVTTVAGSKIHRDRAPARVDATLIRHMEAAGAILLGAQHMDEYAYGFTTENAHYGAARNPHDPERMTGGSSGGSAAAVAAGMVPLSLGSDTNGSIRVPAAFCGVFGIKPTFGRLSRAGTLGFAHSLDHMGVFARSSHDLARAYDALQGQDDSDPAQHARPIEPCLSELPLGIDGVRCARLGGWFERGVSDDVAAAVALIAQTLRATATVTLPEAERARAAAFCITAAEGGNLHLDDLKTRAADFDPSTRDRLLAGALLPAAIVQQAQRFRRWFYQQTMPVFRHYDLLLAAATPVTALKIGSATMTLGAQSVPARANIGLYTQPISFIGLPVVTVPVHSSGRMPVGVQIIAAPWREDLALRAAAWLERSAVVSAPIATPQP